MAKDPYEDHLDRQRKLNALRDRQATASLVPSGPEGRKSDQAGNYATDDGDYHHNMNQYTKRATEVYRDMGPGVYKFPKQDEENEPARKWRR